MQKIFKLKKGLTWKAFRRTLLSILLMWLISLSFYSKLVEKGVAFSQTQNAGLDFYVKNVNGNYVTDGKGIVKRYDSGWHLIDQVSTDASGKATWSNIAPATYNFEVYYGGAGGQEFWGDTSITLGSTVYTYTFTRFMPICLSVWIGDVNGTQRTSFNAGETVRTKFTVKNNGYWTLSCKVRALWDKDQITPYDSDQTTALSSVSGNGATTVFTVDYAIPSESGTSSMRLAYWIWTQLLNGNTLVTDSWFWTTYTITINRAGPLPDKSFVVLQFDVESDADNMTSGHVSQNLIGTIHDIGTLLQQLNLRGTFFVQGACFDNQESGPALTQEIQQLMTSNEIGSHFYSHLQGMGTMPADQILKELNDTENAANMKFYGARVPYFDYSNTIFDQLLAEGYIYDSSVWSGGDNTPYAIPRGAQMLYELPWRCSDFDTSYSVIKSVLDNYTASKENLTLALHPEYIAEDWNGFSQLMQAIANYKSNNAILVPTSQEVINYIFQLSQSDLAVNPVDMKLVPSTHLVNGTSVSIGAVIHNIDGSSAENFIVRFYDGSPTAGGIKIGNDILIPQLNASLVITANIIWIAANGIHSIYVFADADNSVSEKDENNNIAHLDVVVYSQLAVAIAPRAVQMEVGQSQTFNSTISGGVQPYSYQWYLNENAVSGGTSSQLLFTPITAGTSELYLNVTDSIGITTKSNVANTTVAPALSASISPPSAASSIGQSVTFNCSVSGGVPPYAFQWYVNETPVSGATIINWTFNTTTTGQYLIYAEITDSLTVAKQSNVASLVVSPELAVSMAPTAATMDVGQSIAVTCSVNGGTAPYGYQWFLNDAAVSGATSSTWNFSPTSDGSYSVYLIVNDTTGSASKSNTASIIVNPKPLVSILPSLTTINFGQSCNLTSTVSGGNPSYKYQWLVNGSSIPGATGPTFQFSPLSSGYYRVSLKIIDGADYSMESNVATVVVLPVLSAEIETVDVSPGEALRGGSLNVTVYIKNTGKEASRFYVGASIIGEEENVWKDLPGWTMSSVINPKATSAFTFESYVIPADAYIGFHGILIKVWSDPTKTQNLTEKWFPEVVEVKIPFLSDLSQRVKLVFSEDESFFPVPGSYYDGDNDISNNYQHYNPQDVGTYLADRDGDGQKDAPAYVHVVEESDYYVIECWLYYAYDSKSLSSHEHDFEYAFFWVDIATGELKRVAFNQHRWTNNYEFTSDPGTLYVGLEKSGHSMILLDLNGDGSFSIRKPDNCAVLAPELVTSFGTFSKSSVIASLYPWEIYDGKNPVEGFGESGVLVKGVNYDLLDISVVLGLEKPQFYLDAVDEALNTPMLLASSAPFTINLGLISVPFYIQAPWTRAVFDDPELQWKKVSFEWWIVKANVKIVASLVVNKLVADILSKILVGSIVNQAILGLFDPVQASVVDNNGRVLGYQGETLVSEIPGGMIFFKGTLLDAYFIVNATGDYAYYVKGLGTQDYNMTIVRMNPDGSTTEFDAKMIPIDKTTQHKYTLNWTLLTQGKDGMTLLIDENGDGNFERTITAGNSLSGSELALPWWSNLWWVMAAVVSVSVATASVVYYKTRKKKT